MKERSVRLSIDISSEERQLIRMASALRHISIREYVVNAIKAQLSKDLSVSSPEVSRFAIDSRYALNAKEEPVLAELWDNDEDAAYDRL